MRLTEVQAGEAEAPTQAPFDRTLRKLLDHVFTFVGALSPQGMLLEASRASLQAVGLTADDVIGRPFWACHWGTTIRTPQHGSAWRSRARRAVKRKASASRSASTKGAPASSN